MKYANEYRTYIYPTTNSLPRNKDAMIDMTISPTNLQLEDLVTGECFNTHKDKLKRFKGNWPQPQLGAAHRPTHKRRRGRPRKQNTHLQVSGSNQSLLDFAGVKSDSPLLESPSDELKDFETDSSDDYGCRLLMALAR